MNLPNLNYSLQKFIRQNKNGKLKSFTQTLNKYTFNDWIKYIKYNNNTYNRNLVYSNKNYDMYIMTWLPNQTTDFHNHSENGCLMKILSGNLTENMINNNNIKQVTVLKKNDVTYIDDLIGIHKISNNSDNVCVSLHIYSPGHKYSNV